MSADESITELAAAVAELGALPMPVPVGPEPLTAEREAEIREWVEVMGRKRDIRYYGSWQQHGELLGEIDRLRARVTELERTVQQMCDGLNGHDCPPPGEKPMGLVTRFAVRLMEAERLVAELEALTPARIQTCRVCGAGYTYGQRCTTCEFKARMASELQARGLDGEFHAYLHHPYQREHDMPETGGA